MLTVLSAFWQIALFRLGPEDLPDSNFFLGVALGAFVLVEIAAIVSLHPLPMLVPLLLVDVALLALWSGILLALNGLSSRFRPTLAALFGSGAVLQLFAFPFSVILPDSISLTRVIALVLILLWSVAVYGHIISRALARSFGVGVAFAVVYFIVSFELLARLLADT